MDDIKKIGHNIWLVHGKVSGSTKDGVFDDSTSEGRADLIRIADVTCEDEMFPRRGQPLRAAYFQNTHPSIGGRFLLTGRPHFKELPEDIRAVLRKAFPEHASEF